MTASEFEIVCRDNGVTLDEGQVRCFIRYAELLTGWNTKVNLISRKDIEQLWERHLLHGAALLFRELIPENARVADIGTGGGIPGIPLKICRPDISVVLFDSVRKKIAAVSSMLVELRIVDKRMEGIQALCGRVEDLSERKEFAHTFDIVAARAVAPLSQLVAWAAPLLKRNGRLLALKGGTLDREVAEVHRLGLSLSIHVEPLSVNGVPWFETEQKQIVVVQRPS